MKFTDMKPLNRKIAIYVPSTFNVDKKINNSKYVEKTQVFLSNRFGGCTTFQSFGCYVSENNKLIKEKVTICYANTDENTFIIWEKDIIDFAMFLKKEMKQECISVEIDNSLYFI